MGGGLSADGTLDGPPAGPNAVLLHNDSYALITKAVPAC